MTLDERGIVGLTTQRDMDEVLVKIGTSRVEELGLRRWYGGRTNGGGKDFGACAYGKAHR